MKTKVFDCVEMKRQGADLVQKQTDGKNIDEQLLYWKNGTEQLKKKQVQLKEKHLQTPDA